VTDGECVYMGKSTPARVMGLKVTFGKLLPLGNVLYVPSLHRNLVSSILPNKAGLKTVVGDDKIAIFHNRVFPGMGFLNGIFFVLNLTSKTMNGNPSNYAYIAEFVDLWHGRLG